MTDKKAIETKHKTQKWHEWDKMCGWAADTLVFHEWKSKNHYDYYLKDCPHIQTSDPDMPF